MAEYLTLHCRCGAMCWRIADDARGTHAACYCADCQTFARHLGAGDDWLDADGGTEVLRRQRLAPFVRQDGSPVRMARILTEAERRAARPG